MPPSSNPRKQVETAAEMVAVLFGFEPGQAERLLRDIGAGNVDVRIDWEKGTTIGGACGISTSGRRFAEHVRAFDAKEAPNA